MGVGFGACVKDTERVGGSGGVGLSSLQSGLQVHGRLWVVGWGEVVWVVGRQACSRSSEPQPSLVTPLFQEIPSLQAILKMC